MNAKTKGLIQKGSIYLLLIGISVIFLYPTIWMVSSSLKTQNQMFERDLNVIPNPVMFENYARAWSTANFSVYFVNTLIFAVSVVILQIVLASSSGYVMARHSFPLKSAFLVAVMFTLLVPQATTIIPLFHLVRLLGLMNTRWGYILAAGGGGLTLGILLFMGFFKGIPTELEDAAKIDGCNLPQRYWHVMLPLARPVIATITITGFVGAWKSFLLPLIFTLSRPNLRTLAVGMVAFVGENSTDWPGMAAAASISLLPMMIVFMLFQRYFIQGLAGAVKG
ncbi:MAG: carbohydrate ABC transporter permease [bacterium]|nr:carbohydrate ABC transporter permease [bacterium]